MRTAVVFMLVTSLLCGQTHTWTDSDCLTADGSTGLCTAISDCGSSYHRQRAVMCRYSRGYGTRICCPRSFTSSYMFGPAEGRDDFYSDDQPISFPAEDEYRPYNQHTTPHHTSLVGQDPDYRPYNSRPSYNKPQYHEKPSYGDEFDGPSYEYPTRPRPSNTRPRPSYEFTERPRPSYESTNRPRPSYGNQNRPRPSYEDTDRPSYEYPERPRPSYTTERPNPFYGNEDDSRPSYNTQNRPSRPKPAGWDTSEDSGYGSGRRTTPRPTWAVSGESEHTDSSSRRRISEQKCEEYSRQVTDTIDVLPLSIEAEAVPLKVQKCDFSALKLIVGGEAAELGEFPHMAAVGFRSYGSQNVLWNCGGTLISDRYVMTAGHCTNTSNGNPVVVRLGEYNLANDRDGADPEDFAIDKVITHPNYYKSLKYNDIALLRLSRSVNFNKYIRPACLPTENTVRGKPVACGWGRTDFVGKLSDILMKVGLSVIDNRQCNTFYSTNNPGSSSFSSGIVDTMLCAGELQGGRDTCLGDSGGPLTVTKKENACIHYVVGITSFGKICGAPLSPGVYTRVFKFLPWIERTVWS